MTVEKTTTPAEATTGANSAVNQSEFFAVTCNLLKAREKSRVQGAIGQFRFASHSLENWHEILKLITTRSGNRNRNRNRNRRNMFL